MQQQQWKTSVSALQSSQQGQQPSIHHGMGWREGGFTEGSWSNRMDLLTSRLAALSKKLAFTKERCGKGNLDGMVLE